MDVDKLSSGEKVAGVSAILLFVFMFFDWFSVEVSGGNGILTAAAVGAGSAWDTLDFIPIVLVIPILAALGVVALRLTDSVFEPPIPANSVVAILGGLSFLLILFRIVDTPDFGVSGLPIDVSPSLGIFLGLLAAAGIAYGGYRAMQEEGASFADIGDRLSSGSAAAPRTDPPPSSPPPGPSSTPPPAPSTSPPPAPGGNPPPPAPPSADPPPPPGGGA
jgi:hypothetical protein